MKGSKKLLQIGEEVGEKLESERCLGAALWVQGRVFTCPLNRMGSGLPPVNITRGSVHPPHHPAGASVLGLAATWKNKEEKQQNRERAGQ